MSNYKDNSNISMSTNNKKKTQTLYQQCRQAAGAGGPLARFGLGRPSPTVQTHGWIPPCCGQIWLHSLIWPREARSGLPITRSPAIRFGWRQPDLADHDQMLLASVIVKGVCFFLFLKKATWPVGHAGRGPARSSCGTTRSMRYYKLNND